MVKNTKRNYILFNYFKFDNFQVDLIINIFNKVINKYLKRTLIWIIGLLQSTSFVKIKVSYYIYQLLNLIIYILLSLFTLWFIYLCLWYPFTRCLSAYTCTYCINIHRCFWSVLLFDDASIFKNNNSIIFMTHFLLLLFLFSLFYFETSITE